MLAAVGAFEKELFGKLRSFQSGGRLPIILNWSSTRNPSLAALSLSAAGLLAFIPQACQKGKPPT